MTNPTLASVANLLDTLKSKEQYRQLPNIKHQDKWIVSDNKTLLNISSNDYLGLNSNSELQIEFLDNLQTLSESSPHLNLPKMGSSSSRLLTGNHEQLRLLEEDLTDWYQLAFSLEQTLKQTSKQTLNKDNAEQHHTKQNHTTQNQTSSKSVLVVNSGYHANIGILPALAQLPLKTLIVADKLVHASIIDGVRLIASRQCTYKRYRHNDLVHLASIIEQAEDDIERIIVVTESIFSMDGDSADLKALAELKAKDARIELYVDEAHAVGVLGRYGLGLAEETQTLSDIDYLVGTFGKAFASMGAYIICDDKVRLWLINQMRSLIFSTALPPITHSWTRFVLAKMPDLHLKRTHLANISVQVATAINATTINADNDSDVSNSPVLNSKSSHETAYQSPIIPYILGENIDAMNKAKQLREAGFYALPIRPPTVPAGTARIRIVMNAELIEEDCRRLIAQL